MYDEKLEQLIDAALADGELTEKEKQILFKKAQTMGVDLDEFEMVLDARLVKLKKAEEEQAASSAPKSDKFGDVKKCPACGTIVQSYQGVCSECGYAFENIKSVNSAKELSDKLESINEKYNRKEAAIEGNTTDDGDKRFSIRKDKNAALAQAIKTFPIPTSKSDLFEMLIMLQTSALDVSTHREVASAYMSKYKECLKKSKLLSCKTFSVVYKTMKKVFNIKEVRALLKQMNIHSFSFKKKILFYFFKYRLYVFMVIYIKMV